MKTIFTKFASYLLPGITVIWANFKILAFRHAQWKSIRERMAVDADGNPIPWYTYPAIEYLKNFDFTECDVFEFGSGNSSFYWSNRARSVVSVEDNNEWYEVVNSRKSKNQTLIHRSEEVDYVNSLTEQAKMFDIIIIDGNHRMSCTFEAIKWIKDDGIILLDNSDRSIEKECGKVLRNNQFIQIDFSGFGPINGYCWTTSMFLKNARFFQSNYSGPAPVGGLGN